MEHTIPTRDWPTALIEAIELAQDGDVIIVHDVAMRELASRASQRMCPDKGLAFEIQAPGSFA